MSNPETQNAATQSESKPSLEEQLNNVVKNMEFDEQTNTYKLPEDIPEELKLAALAEKRRRDTQASLTKSRQELKALEAKAKKLEEVVYSSAKLNLSDEEKSELEDLKFTDPEAWRIKMNQLEQQAKEQVVSKLNEFSTEAEKAAELERRNLVLQEFLMQNPGLQLNDEVIANDIPPRITKKLDSGEISFEEFLEESKKYLTKVGAVVKDTVETPNVPNLNKVGGGSSATVLNTDDLVKTYENEVY